MTSGVSNTRITKTTGQILSGAHPRASAREELADGPGVTRRIPRARVKIIGWDGSPGRYELRVALRDERSEKRKEKETRPKVGKRLEKERQGFPGPAGEAASGARDELTKILLTSWRCSGKEKVGCLERIRRESHSGRAPRFEDVGGSTKPKKKLRWEFDGFSHAFSKPSNIFVRSHGTP